MPDLRGVAGKAIAEDKTWEFEQYEERIAHLEKLIEDLKTVNNFLGIYEDLRASIREKANKQPEAGIGNITIFDEEGDIEDSGLKFGNVEDLINTGAVDEDGNVTVINLFNDLYRLNTYYITQQSKGTNIRTEKVMKSVIHLDGLKGNISIPFSNLSAATEMNPIPFSCVGEAGGITLTCTSEAGEKHELVIPMSMPMGRVPVTKTNEETGEEYIEEVYSEIAYENSKYGYYDRVLHIASYNGEPVNTPFISSTGKLSQYAHVLYVNPNPTFHEFPDQRLFYKWKSFDGVNIITSSDAVKPEISVDLAYLRPGQLLLDLFGWVAEKIVLADIPSGESKSVYVGTNNPKDTDFLVWVDPSDNTLKYRTDPDSNLWYVIDTKNSVYIGSNTPAIGTPYMVWVDTSSNVIKYRLNNASNNWMIASADIVHIGTNQPATSSTFIVWIDTSVNVVKYRANTTSSVWTAASAVWN